MSFHFHISRRAFFPCLGAVGLREMLPSMCLGADDNTASSPTAATFAGLWTYRSFLNNPDITIDFNKLEFARADLQLDEVALGVLQGKLSFGTDHLAVKGSIAYGNPFSARFEGRGATPETEGWIYNYQGYLVPAWPDGVDQRPAIIGSVIRTVPHSNGMAKAGVTASFVAVRRDQ